MERREFIERVGLGSAFALTLACLNGCSQTSVNPSAAGNVNITIDLTAAENAALLKSGGYLIKNSVVIAKTIDGQYLAASSVCTHEGGQVVYRSSSNDWFCGTHGAEYNLQSGAGLNSFGRGGLKVYTTSLTGNILTVS